VNRITSLAVAALVGASSAVAPAFAAPHHVAAKHSYTTKDATVAVVDGPHNDHHATIDTRLYIPETATRAHPQPAILMTHGFGLSKLSTEVVATAKFLARHGYIVLTWTSQGFGTSSGCIRLDSFDYDVKDAKQLVRKLLTPRHDVLRDKHGLVLGMTGGSYGGGITLNVAAADPQVRAIVPGRTWNALAYSLDPNNYVAPGDRTGFTHLLNLQGVFKAQWTSLFFAAGNGTPVGGIPPTGKPQGGCVQDKLASGEPTVVAGAACTGYPAQVCQVYAHTAATGDARASDRALLEHSSVAWRIRHLHAATLLLQGQSDTLFNENDAVATYVALKRRHVPVAMTWNSGGHGGYNSKPGECDVYGGGDTGLDHCYLTLRTLQWFDHYLRGKPLRHFANFTYYEDWVRHTRTGSDGDQYGTARSYLHRHARTFRLSGSGRLVSRRGAVVTGQATFLNPPGGQPASYSETSNFSAPGDAPDLSGRAPFDPPQESVSFTSAPFTHAYVSVGVPSARLHMSHVNGRDLVFFGKVFDVAPNGSTTLIHRLVAPVRVPASRVSDLVTIKLLGFAHLFRKGHRVRLTLASTDQAYYNSKIADAISVRTQAKHPSVFVLPLRRWRM
jgi:predicted acyl esterase